MTKEAALHLFFSEFGIPAYASSSVLDDIKFPFLAYNIPTSAFDDGEIEGTVYLRYYTESEATPNAKAQEISDAIGMGGVFLHCDKGSIWIKRSTPFKINATQEQGTEESKFLKTKQLNITVEYFTFD